MTSEMPNAQSGSLSDVSGKCEYGQRPYYVTPPSYNDAITDGMDKTSCALADGRDEHIVTISRDAGIGGTKSNGRCKVDTACSRRCTLARVHKGLNCSFHLIWAALFAFVLVWIFTQRGGKDNPSEHRNITKEDIDVITSDVTDLRADFNRLSNDVSRLSNDVTSMKKTFSSDINNMGRRIDELEKEKDDSETSFNKITSRLSYLESILSSIQAQLSKNGSSNLKIGWSTVLLVAVGLIIGQNY